MNWKLLGISLTKGVIFGAIIGLLSGSASCVGFGLLLTYFEYKSEAEPEQKKSF